MTDIQTPPPPPPPPPSSNYILFGLLGVIVGLAIAVVVLLVTAGDDEAATTTVVANPTIAATSSTSDPPPTTPSTLPPFPGDTGDEVAAGDPFGSFNFLHDVRVQQREEGFTRIVFEFEDGDIPWWSVGYAAGPFTSISDEPIPINGAEFLRVVLSSVGYDLSGAEVRITYDGPERIAAGTNSVVEVVLIDDFEGVSTWVIGVDAMRSFSVGTLTDPPRVYVDIED